jgi:hypothetical protein
VWGRRLALYAIGAALLCLWGTSLAVAKAKPKPKPKTITATYEVEYGGKGSMASRENIPIACGNVNRVENSDFSWSVKYKLRVEFRPKGFSGGQVDAVPEGLAGANEHSTVTWTAGASCGPTAACDGYDHPDDKSAILQAQAATLGKRISFKVGAINYQDGYFQGENFTGSSSLPTSPGTSCASYFNANYGFGVLLVPETGLGKQLQAEFTVPYAALKGLKPDDLLDFKVTPGSNAPAHTHACYSDDGCLSETWEWHGEVSIKRES